MKRDCFLTDNSLVSNEIIVTILGNLIDNAINACRLDLYSPQKCIELKIKQIESKLYILINNTISKDITETTLSDGTGIKNIKKIVQKNNGFYTREIKGGYYKVKIILWSKDNNINEGS